MVNKNRKLEIFFKPGSTEYEKTKIQFSMADENNNSLEGMSNVTEIDKLNEEELETFSHMMDVVSKVINDAIDKNGEFKIKIEEEINKIIGESANVSRN